MKKGLIITILVLGGLVVAGGLVVGAILELVQAVIGFVIWSVIILVGYFFIKSKVD